MSQPCLFCSGSIKHDKSSLVSTFHWGLKSGCGGRPDRAESLDAKLLLRMLWVSVTATAAALTCFCPILVSKVTECGAEWRRRHIHHIQPAISQPATQIGKCKNVKFSAQADYSASSCGGLVNTPSLHVPAPGCRTAQLLNIHFLLRLTGDWWAGEENDSVGILEQSCGAPTSGKIGQKSAGSWKSGR